MKQVMKLLCAVGLTAMLASVTVLTGCKKNDDSTVTYPEAPELECLKIAGTVWAPVNCGYDAKNYKYGKLYQFGRAKGCGYNAKWAEETQGPETEIQTYCANPETTSDPADDKFYKGGNTGDWYDGDPKLPSWPMKSGDTGYKAGKIANPCPSGWRVPTYDELNALIGNTGDEGIGGEGWDDTNKGYWFNGTTSPSVGAGLFFPAAGYRPQNPGTPQQRGISGNYLMSSVSNGGADAMYFDEECAYVCTEYFYCADACSVRCVQE